jgi:hypothetical protein
VTWIKLHKFFFLLPRYCAHLGTSTTHILDCLLNISLCSPESALKLLTTIYLMVTMSCRWCLGAANGSTSRRPKRSGFLPSLKSLALAESFPAARIHCYLPHIQKLHVQDHWGGGGNIHYPPEQLAYWKNWFLFPWDPESTIFTSSSQGRLNTPSKLCEHPKCKHWV